MFIYMFAQHYYESYIDLHAEMYLCDSANDRSTTSITVLELLLMYLYH